MSVVQDDHILQNQLLRKQEEKIMKKILALLLALVMVLSLAACGAKEEAPATEAPKLRLPLLPKLPLRRLPRITPAIWLSTPPTTLIP